MLLHLLPNWDTIICFLNRSDNLKCLFAPSIVILSPCTTQFPWICSFHITSSQVLVVNWYLTFWLLSAWLCLSVAMASPSAVCARLEKLPWWNQAAGEAVKVNIALLAPTVCKWLARPHAVSWNALLIPELPDRPDPRLLTSPKLRWTLRNEPRRKLPDQVINRTKS